MFCSHNYNNNKTISVFFFFQFYYSKQNLQTFTWMWNVDLKRKSILFKNKTKFKECTNAPNRNEEDEMYLKRTTLKDKIVLKQEKKRKENNKTIRLPWWIFFSFFFVYIKYYCYDCLPRLLIIFAFGISYLLISFWQVVVVIFFRLNNSLCSNLLSQLILQINIKLKNTKWFAVNWNSIQSIDAQYKWMDQRQTR